MVIILKNKILVELIVPDLDEKYDLYIPVNKKVGNIINLLNKALKELSRGVYLSSKDICIYNRNTGEKYPIDILVRETDIRNGASLVII